MNDLFDDGFAVRVVRGEDGGPEFFGLTFDEVTSL